MPTSRSAGSATALAIDEIAEARDPLDDGHEEQWQRKRDHRDGRERGGESELEEREDLDGDRLLARRGEEQRQVDVGERMDESEHGAGDETVLDQWEHDMAKR